MKVVIVGAGEVGVHVAKQLTEEGKDVVLIERDAESAKRASSLLDTLVVVGDATNTATLKEAGTSRADIFVATSTDDEVNLISCFMVNSEFDVPIKIARVRNENYTKSEIFSTGTEDIMYIVNTDEEAAKEIIDMVKQGESASVSAFDNINIQLRDFHVDKESFFLGKSVKDLRLELKEDFIVAGIVRNDEVTIPDGEFIIDEGDDVHIVTNKKIFNRLAPKIGSRTDVLKSIAVVGGTPIGSNVAETLSAMGRKVILIDRDYAQCKTLAEELPQVLVINGDISDQTLYAEENLQDMDAIICTTQNEELNIISGLYAKTIGVKRAIAVVEKTNYLSLANDIGIDSIVSPRFCAVNAIIKFIRKGNVSSIHSIFEGDAEAIEVYMTDKSVFINQPLKDIKLPSDCRVVAVTRGRRNIIPNGNTIIKQKDRVVFFVKRPSIPELEQMLI
jgi:trk system potassium uptake protein TrkA